MSLKLVKDKKHPDMYRIKWENGDISVGSVDPKPWEVGGHYGFYNKTRAKELIKLWDGKDIDRGVSFYHPLGRSGKPAGELFLSSGTQIA